MFAKRMVSATRFFLLCFTGLGFVVQASNQGSVVATVNGENISLASLSKGSELDIYKAEKKLYELRMGNLRRLLISKLILLDPKSKGLSEEQFVNRFIADPRPVTDPQVDEFILKRRIPKDKINLNLKEQVRSFLAKQQIAQQIDVWLDTQRRKHNIEINLDKPLEPRFNVDIDGAAYRGGENAKVTIVEFSDFECPYCVRANNTLRQLDQIYGDKIKLVYKHFPLPNHSGAPKAAEATICAQQQGIEYFWQLHDKFFEKQRKLSLGVIKDLAKELELDNDAFNQCLNSGAQASVTEKDLAQGRSLGVQSTPAFFINGRNLTGAQPIEVFRKIIDQELK